MNKHIVVFWASLLTIIPSAWSQVSISLSPTEAYLRGNPGTTVTQEFVVMNDGSVPYFLGCTFNDLWFDGEKPVSGELGTYTQRQAGYQLQCSPNKILVPPKHVQKITMVGAIPKDQDGERYARFYAQMLPPDDHDASAPKSPRASIGFSASVGATVALMAEGTQKISSEITDVRIESTKRFQTLHLKIKNTGNVHINGTGTVVIMDTNEKFIQKAEVKIPFVFPDQAKAVAVNLPDILVKGNYKALMSITGTTSQTTFAKEFSIQLSK